MKLLFADEAWADYLWWQSGEAPGLAKLNTLIENCRRTPFNGLGKPEPLRGEFSGYWSRRITSEHRLVYRVTDAGEAQQLEILQCRFHYR